MRRKEISSLTFSSPEELQAHTKRLMQRIKLDQRLLKYLHRRLEKNRHLLDKLQLTLLYLDR